MMKQNSKENFDLSLAAGRFRARAGDRAFCLICQTRVKLPAYGQAAESFKTDAEDIRELAESRRLHRIHNLCGATMICAESLAALFESRPTRRLKPDFLPFNEAGFQTDEDI